MLCHLNRLLAKLSAGALGVIAFLLLNKKCGRILACKASIRARASA